MGQPEGWGAGPHAWAAEPLEELLEQGGVLDHRLLSLLQGRQAMAAAWGKSRSPSHQSPPPSERVAVPSRKEAREGFLNLLDSSPNPATVAGKPWASQFTSRASGRTVSFLK